MSLEHTFKYEKLKSGLKYCDACKRLIFTASGFKCTECAYQVHKKCLATAPSNCSRRANQPASSDARESLMHTHALTHLDDLVRAVRLPGSGLAVRDRKVLFHTYHDAFVASELVDWLLTDLPFRSREDAAALGQRLVDKAYIARAVEKDRDVAFVDDNALYVFVKELELGDDEDDDDDDAAATASPATASGAASPGLPDSPVRRSGATSPALVAEDGFADAANSSDDDAAADDNGGGDDAAASGRAALTSSRAPESARKALAVTDFELIKVVGKGAFGKVLKVRKIDTGRQYAMKVMDKALFSEEKHIRSLMAERDIMLNDCPFLVHLYFSFQSAGKLYFVMDFVSGGDLSVYFDRVGRFSEAVTRHFAAQLALALEFLHKHNIVYRDLKPENILIDEGGNIVLTDFGLSKFVGDHSVGRASTVCGTACYLAPEVLQIAVESARRKQAARSSSANKSADGGTGGTGAEAAPTASYDHRCDLWSLGVVMYEMLSGVNPFVATSFTDMAQRVLRSAVPFTTARLGSSEAVDLLQKLLTRQPDQRITIDELKGHAWFAPLNWRDVAVKRTKSPFLSEHSAEDKADPEITDTIEDVIHDTGHSVVSRIEGIDYTAPLFIEDPLAFDEPPVERPSSAMKKNASVRASSQAAAAPAAPVAADADDKPSVRASTKKKHHHKEAAATTDDMPKHSRSTSHAESAPTKKKEKTGGFAATADVVADAPAKKESTTSKHKGDRAALSRTVPTAKELEDF
jgi:serine/threonine protein kinase